MGDVGLWMIIVIYLFFFHTMVECEIWYGISGDCDG